MPFQFEPYQSPYTGTIVDLMQAPARARAAALRAQGQATAQTVGGIGQAVTGTIGSILQQRADAPKREMMQLELQKARSDESERQNALAGGKRVAALLTQNPQATDQEVITAAGDPLLGMHLLQTLRPPKKLIAVKDGESLIDEAKPDNGAVFTAPAKPERPLVVNGSLVTPTGQVIATPPNPAQAEIARHNREMERIGGLTAGRQQAAQAETARHNRATETANNPFGNVSFGASAAPGTAPPPPGSPAAPSASGKNDAVLQNLPPGVPELVKRLSEGKSTFPNGMALSKPYWQNMLQLVGQYDPSFDAVNYNSRSQTRQKFTSGAEAKQVNALNTVIGHLSDLSTAADKLNNSWSPKWNSIANAVSTATGHPEVKQFDTIANAVSDEATRVWRQAGGTEADIKSWKDALNAAGSPEQIHAVIATIGDLLNSKLDAMQNQYQQGMGTSDVKMITPQAEATLAKLRNKAGTTAPAQTASGSAPIKVGGFTVVVK